MIPYVLIVGRPNVGKSSLFNSLTRHKIAIISEQANTTRDVIEYSMKTATGKEYILADSGGLNIGKTTDILQDVNERVVHHVDRSDLILFICEYTQLTTEDDAIVEMLRKSGKPVYVLANKADNPERVLEAYNLSHLGFDGFFPISVSHRLGFTEFLEEVSIFVDALNTVEDVEDAEEDESIKIALIGRPNVGKSSIFNRLLGEEKVLVRDEWGTTRDSTDTRISFEDETITLIDTAGLRKPGKVGTRNIENWSMMRTDRSIDRSDVCAVIMDPVEGITQQDKNILGMALEQQKGIILIFNKWDLAREGSEYDEEETRKRFLSYMQKHFGFAPWAATVFCSATEDTNIQDILLTGVGIYKERQKRIPTGIFNNLLEQVAHKHPPRGTRKSHKPKVYFGSQVDRNPPRFVISVNNADQFHFSWKRYLENQLREFFGFHGTPLDIEFKGRDKKLKKMEDNADMDDE